MHKTVLNRALSGNYIACLFPCGALVGYSLLAILGTVHSHQRAPRSLELPAEGQGVLKLILQADLDEERHPQTPGHRRHQQLFFPRRATTGE